MHRRLALIALLLSSFSPLARTGVRAAEDDILAGSPDSAAANALAVHVGAGDGKVEIALAKEGRFLVHGISASGTRVERARAAVRAAGVYGLASIDEVRTLERLPYASSTVDLLIADLDELGDEAPSEAEILRVLAPGGTARIQEKGSRRTLVKERPKGMGEWTHYDHGADGNPVSSDTLVAPVTSLRWLAAPSISRAGSTEEAGLRLAGGRIVYALKDYGIEGRDPRGEKNALVCRNAYNGLLLWKVPITREKYTPYRHELIASKDRIYTVTETPGPMVALDARTGREVLRFVEGVRVGEIERDERGREDRSTRHLVARLHEGRLVQAYRSLLRVLDAESGRRLWEFSTAEGHHIPLAVVGDRKVFAAIGSEPVLPMRGTVAIKLGSIAAFDLETGEELWRNRDLEGNYLVRLVYHRGSLPVAYFPGTDRKGRKRAPMSGYGHRFAVANLSSSDGRTVWRAQEEKSVGGHYAITFARDGKAFVACERYIGYDLESGAIEESVAQRTFVNSCAETRATVEYVLYGMSFADREGNFSPRAVARSTCDTGVFPANGLVYSSPPLCSCLDVLAAYSATAAEDPPRPVADDARLVAGEARPPQDATDANNGDVPAGDWPDAGDWPMFLGGPRRSSSSARPLPEDLELAWKVDLAGPTRSPLAEEGWREAEVPSAPVTPPSAADGRVFVAASHEHRLEARDGATGERLWSFTCGGRIDSPPTIYRGLALFGSRDGRVYALRADDGRLVWRFLAGLEEKRIVADGQLESPWPAFGSVMVHDGALWFTAGRHSAIDGGIALYKLEPSSGRMLWRARIASGHVEAASSRDVPVYPHHGERGLYYPRVAHLLVSDGKRLHHFIETIEKDYETGERVAVLPTNGRWDRRVKTEDFTWLRSNMSGFLSRRPHSVGRWDHDGVRYGDLSAGAIAFTDDALYCANGRRRGKRGGLGALARLPLDASGALGEEPRWKARLRHRSDDREHGNFEVAALALAGDRLFLAGWVPETTESALHACSAATGDKVSQWSLPARPVRNGLAIAGGRIFVALEDGTLACFAGRSDVETRDAR